MLKLRSKKGFTLIELMIVVAIIGILAAIAIPNFMRFQAKSRQSEAKTNLGGIFTAETAYFAEHNAFANLGTVSWAPIGTTGRYRYTTGAGTDMGLTTVALEGWVTATPQVYNDAVNGDFRFTAGAQGSVDTDARNDQWTINDIRDLRNYVDDVVVN
jgi:type IV pilus assembly protein PilA